MTEELKIVADSNEEMLRYFKQLHSDHLEKIQTIKEGLFEINIRLDELEKTRKVYSLNIDYRKNVFSPLSDDNSVNEKETELRSEMNSLLDRREELENRLAEETFILKSLEGRLKKLDMAKQEIREMAAAQEEEENAQDAFEFVREEEEPDPAELLRQHGQQILLLKSFDQTYYTTVLDKKLRGELDTLSHRLGQAEDFIRMDPNRSAMLLREARQNMDRIYQIVDGQLRRLGYNKKENVGVHDMVQDYLLRLREVHPEVVIDADIGEFPFALNTVQTRETLRLFSLFFDNIYRHAQASRVDVRMTETASEVVVEITDNGKGLPPDARSGSPWYSGLHRAEEILFLLGGSFHITPNYPKGTSVRFSFPIDPV